MWISNLCSSCSPFYFKRCIIAAFARPAFSIVCSESVSSLLGNVVNNANVWAAYCGRALKRKIDSSIKARGLTEIHQKLINLDWTYFTTYERKSLIVCDKLNRPESRLPSASRICIEVVGCDESKFNRSFALNINFNRINNNRIS